jgi:hypothetical protein
MHFTYLAAAMGALFLAVVLGLWLSSLYLVHEQPPKGMVVGLIHGTVGAVTVALVFLALRGPGTNPGPHFGHPAGNFGWTAFVTLVIALLGGLTILAMRLIRKSISPVLIGLHATLGIAGAVILCAYWITPSSYGR